MNGDQRKMISTAIENCDLLTDWEYDFVNSLADKDPDYPLSEKQHEQLWQISQKIDQL